MRATVLVDNVEGGNLRGEWGLAVYIEYNGAKILLDTGASKLFAENARKLGVPLDAVDYAALSHAHFDHSDGMDEFFKINTHAKFFLQDCCGENCYEKILFFHKYIGIKRGLLGKYADRIEYVPGKAEVCEGVRIIPHYGSGREAIGKREHMYVRTREGWRPDDFSHEQSLVFETESGLVVFNSCSHGGAANIVREVSSAYDGRKIHAIIGGFHLYNKSAKEVRAFASELRNSGVEKVYTGHCTGDRALTILEEELGSAVTRLRSGLVMEFK